MAPLLELEGTWEEIITHAAALAGRRVRLTVLPPPPETTPDTLPTAPARDPERVARVKSIRGKFARSGMTLTSDLLHEERQADKESEERIISEECR